MARSPDALHSAAKAQPLTGGPSPQSRSHWVLEQLEPRMLLSADPISAALGDVASWLPGMTTADDPESQNDALHELTSGDFAADLPGDLTDQFESRSVAPFALDSLASAMADSMEDSMARAVDDTGPSTVRTASAIPMTQALDLDALAMAPDAAASADVRELVIVDVLTPNYQQMLDDLQQRGRATGLDVLLLDAGRDGIEQIGEALAHYDDLDALHIVSHGANGAVQLGNTLLTQDSLAQYADAIAGWKDAFSEQADLLFYGCNLAQDSDGQALVQGLATLTGADVAASTDLTGAAALGGDWDLEYSAGSIEHAAAFSSSLQQQWSSVLASVTVVNNSNIINGDTTDISSLQTTPGADGISLREAIIATNNTPGADQIFLSASTYSLSNGAGEDLSVNGDLDILDDLTIAGVGATLTTIDGPDNDRVFHVHTGVTFTITDTTISGGKASGGGLLMLAGSNVTIERVVIAGNSTAGGSSGGGIYNDGGALAVRDSSFVGNATSGAGGFGGGLYNDGSATLERVTLSGNSAAFGAGIANTGTSLILNNVTISGNIAGDDGGGIWTNQSLTATHLTLTLNNSWSGGSGGPGIYTVNGADVTLQNTILGANTFDGGGNENFFSSDAAALTSLGGNIDDDGSAGLSHVSDTSSPALIDLRLAALVNNGGYTLTHALGAGSTAISHGNGVPLTSDQRGIARDASPDAGAFEFGVTNTAPVLDDSNVDADFVEGSGPVVIDPGMLATDADSIAFHGGVLTVQFASGNDAGDLLSVRNEGTLALQVSVSGTTILYNFGAGPIAVGAVSGGTDASGPLLITFNAAATAEAVQAVTRNLTYDNTSVTPSEADRVVEFTLTDGDSGTSNTEEVIIAFKTTHALWLSANGDTPVSGTNLPDWYDNDVVQIGVGATFGEGTSTGNFGKLFELLRTDTGDADIKAIHYVSTAITVGGGGNTFDLLPGDVIASVESGLDLTSTNTLSVTENDVFVFRPDIPGDYSQGTFSMLLDNAFGQRVLGITLVENITDLGGHALNPGDFLVAHDGLAADDDVFKFVANGVGPGAATGGVKTKLLDGFSFGLNPGSAIIGLDIIERDTVVGDTSVSSGSLLVSLNYTDSIGSNLQLVQPEDVVVLNVTDTETGGGSAATAAILLDGDANLNLSSAAESLDGFTLARTGTASGATANAAPNTVDDTYSVEEDSTLTSGDALFDAGWSDRIRLTFNNAAQSENLTDVPILVALDATRVDYTSIQNAGQDLRFVDRDGTALAHEIESWDETGTSYVWVNVSQIDGGVNTDFIWMYYGNAVAADAQDPTSVWNVDYQGVWHLDETSGGHSDSTGYGNLMNAVGGLNKNAVGAINGADAFDGINDYLWVSSDASVEITGDVTMQAWLWMDNLPASGASLLEYAGFGETEGENYLYTLIVESNGDVLLGHEYGAGIDQFQSIGVTLATDRWYHLSAVRDTTANTWTLYVNGAQAGSVYNYTTEATGGTGSEFYIGWDTGFIDGIIDEPRVAATARSADWIAAQYAAQSDSFIAYGTPQQAAGVLDNDSDPDGDSLTATLLSGPSNDAAFTFNPDGTFSYAPVANFNGVDSFTYMANDGTVDSAITTVTITVNPVLDLTATDDTNSTSEDTALNGDVSGNDATTSGGTLTYAKATDSANGAVIVNAGGTYTYTPDLNFNGTDSFTYTVTDADSGEMLTQSVAITINAVNDAPQNTVPGAQSIPFGGSLTFDAGTATEISVADVDAGSGAIKLTLRAGGGTLTLASVAGLSVAPGADGIADATMTLSGTLGAINTALDGMSFDATTGFFGFAGVTLYTDDQGNSPAPSLDDFSTITIAVGAPEQQLWLSFEDDEDATGNTDIPSVTGGDVVTFGNITALEPGTSSGDFAYLFNLDNFADDGDTKVDAVHRVGHDMTVGSNAIALKAGDLLFSTDGDEDIAGTAFKKEDVLVFRPTLAGDYRAGTVFLLVDGVDLGIGDITALSLIEHDTVVGDVMLKAGDFLIADKDQDLLLFQPGSLGSTSTGTVSVLLDGALLDIGPNIAGVHLVQLDTTLGPTPLLAGQILVSLEGDDADVGSLPGQIATERHDIFVLDVSATEIGGGAGASNATATRLFEGPDENLESNDENLAGLSLSVTQPTPDTNEAPVLSVEPRAFINEVHYNNIGLDVGEFVEVAALAGTDLSGWNLLFYNGNDGLVYRSTALSGVMPDLGDGMGTLTFNLPVNSIQNALDGGADGIALVDDSGRVLEFLSYGGVLTAVDGAAAGMNSTDIGVSENGTTLIGESLQRTGAGATFTWAAPGTETPGAANNGQDFSAAVDALTESISEDGSLLFSSADGNAITVADADAGSLGDPLRMTLSVANGTLTLLPAATAALANVSGDGSSSVSFDGTAAEINAALDGLVYAPDANFNGSDRLTIVANDQGNSGLPGAISDLGQISISITPVTDLTATDDTDSTNEDTTLNGDVSGNDATTSGGTLTWAKTTDPANGAITVNADGTYTYTPAANFNGADSFTYTVTDTNSGEALTQTVNLTVNAVDDLTAADDSNATADGVAVSGDVSTNDSTTSGGALTFAINNDAANGMVSDDGNGAYTYTPNALFSGTDSFTYTVTDADSGEIATQTVTVSVDPVNNAPTALITTPGYAVNENTSFALQGTGLSVADTDAGGATVVATLSVDEGTLSVDAGGTGVALGGTSSTVTLTGSLTQINNLLAGNSDATIGYQAIDSPSVASTLTLSVDDLGNSGFGGALVDTDTATIAITPENDAPLAYTGTASHTVSAPVPLTLHGTGLSVSDPDAGTTPIRAVLSVGEGSLTINAAATGVIVTGDGSTAVTLNGTVTQINELLAGTTGATVNYQAAIAPAATTTLTLTVNDLGNSGIGGALSAADSATLIINTPVTIAPDPAPDADPAPVTPLVADTDPAPAIPPEADADPEPAAGPGIATEPTAVAGLASNSLPDTATAILASAFDSVNAPTSVVVPADAEFRNSGELRADSLDRANQDLLLQLIARNSEDLLSPEDSAVRELPLAQTQASLLQALDNLRNEAETRSETETLLVASTVGASTGLSVGYVAWLLRGGVLLSTLLSSMPAWRLLDPLPVLGRMDDDDDEDDLSAMVEADDSDAPNSTTSKSANINGESK